MLFPYSSPLLTYLLFSFILIIPFTTITKSSVIPSSPSSSSPPPPPSSTPSPLLSLTPPLSPNVTISPSIPTISQNNSTTIIPFPTNSTTIITTTTSTTFSTETNRRSLITSSIMVIVSEIGDKTFLVAAILAMTHSRIIIFMGAWSALAVMSILSALLGNVLPTILSRSYTQPLAGILFFIFGFRMIQEARTMDPNLGTSEEMAEVQAEIKALNKHPHDRLERGLNKPIIPPLNSSSSLFNRLCLSCKHFISLIVSPVFVETFILTFLAEWGDRSQIATIAMSAAGNVVAVIIGTILGHSLCTCIAVIGGKMLAARISVRTVTLIGGIVFLIFALLTFVYSYE